MRKLALTVLVASLVAALPRASRASVFSTMDGSGLGEGTQAVQTWLGLPNLGVLYMQGQPGDFDFGYGLSVDYLKGTAQPVFHIRWSFINADEYNLALTTDFGLWLDSGLTYAEPNNVPNTGLRLTPGIALGMRPHPSYTTFFTVEIPFLWSWGYGGGAVVPVLAGLGLEYAMTPDMNIVVYGKIGPRFETGGGWVGGVWLQAEGWLGLEFRLF